MRLRLFLLLAAAALVAGCASHTRETLLTQTLNAYESTIRWGDVASAMQFIDPEVLEKSPPSELQLARYQQVRISGYSTDGPVPVSETEVRQRVVIGLINVHTQRQREVVDDQLWRYDPDGEHWWLMTGLPDITR